MQLRHDHKLTKDKVMKIRIYNLAKELKTGTKKIIERL